MTTHEIAARARAATDPKRTLSIREWERWLGELEARGILTRDGDGWKPTPLGEIWLGGCFPVDGDEAVAA